MAWVLGYDLDMVFDMTLIWFGNGAACSGLLMGWFGNRKQKQPRGQAFGRFLARFLMVLIWIWYGFDTIVTGFWYDSDMIWIWFEEGNRFFWGFPMGWLEKKNKKQPWDRLLVAFPKVVWVWHDFDRVGFDTILIWCRNASDMILIDVCSRRFQKNNQNIKKTHITVLIPIKNHNWNHIKTIL